MNIHRFLRGAKVAYGERRRDRADAVRSGGPGAPEATLPIRDRVVPPEAAADVGRGMGGATGSVA
ncbi:hypothetical protein GCM10008019_03730 [Deinococcus soli (ex Cha et al. 2016)]|nr:hypothetical protein GCM10008019_03730 [Deinococcus soli (ex Cha et al. 2016)]